MSIPNPTVGTVYEFTAATTNPAIAYDFKVAADTELRVKRTDTNGVVSLLAKPGDYTVSGVGEKAGGSVNLIGSYAIGEKVSIDLVTSPIQSTTFSYTGEWPSGDLESAFDYVVNLVKRALNRASRAFRLPPEDYGTDMVIPSKTARVDKLVGFDSAGDPYYYDLDSVGGGAILPSSYRKSISVGAGATVNMGILTMPNADRGIRLRLLANVRGTGRVTLHEYYVVDLTGEANLIVAKTDDVTTGKTGGETVDFVVTPGVNTLDIDLDGSAFTSAYTVDTRVLIDNITDQNDAAFSYD